MTRAPILDPTESYTFSKYADLPFDAADILAEFGVTLNNASLQLPQQLPIDPEPLKIELEENLALVDPTSEMARREALIFPILKTVTIPWADADDFQMGELCRTSILTPDSCILLKENFPL